MSTSLPFASQKVSLLTDLRQRPALLLRELLWRWLCGGMLLALAGYDGWRIWTASQPALQATGLFRLSSDSLLEDPSQIATAFAAATGIVRPLVEHAAAGLAPLAIFCWVAAFGLGRTSVLASYDARLPRRPWLLAACEGVRVGALLAASAVWSALVQVASSVALKGASPNLLLYAVLMLGATVAVLLVWGRVARAVELSQAIALVESLAFREAFRRAWRPGSTLAAQQVRPIRKAAGRARLFLLVAAFVFTLLPAPFAAGWPLAVWWVVLSLVLLAAADAVRLGVLFALVGMVREARSVTPFAPGVSASVSRVASPGTRH